MSHLQKTEKWRTEKRALMLELLDHPRTGLKESSDTNKTRMELLGILDEMTQIATQSAEAERERIYTAMSDYKDTANVTGTDFEAGHNAGYETTMKYLKEETIDKNTPPTTS